MLLIVINTSTQYVFKVYFYKFFFIFSHIWVIASWDNMILYNNIKHIIIIFLFTFQYSAHRQWHGYQSVIFFYMVAL